MDRIFLIALVCMSNVGAGAPATATQPAPAASTRAADPACMPPTADSQSAAEEPSPWGMAADSIRSVPLLPNDQCEVADSNIRRVEEAIVHHRGAKTGAAPAFQAWDHKSHLAGLPSIRRRFELNASEEEGLRRTGFVVPARLEMPNYTWAFHEIFQSELPVYVSADAILHAVFASHDSLVGDLERRRLSPELDAALVKMHCALPGAAADYPPEVARDLDLYLLVARRLLDDNLTARSSLADAENEKTAAALVAKAHDAGALEEVSILGRARMVDFTQYTPRGHYTEDLAPYFRAAMWLSRLELNLVSRSSRSSAKVLDPRETPREAVLALALTDLALRSQAMAQIDQLDHAWAALAGVREDVSLGQLASLREQAKIRSLRDPGAFEALKGAIGGGFKRTARIHYMPEGSTELPVIATLLGPRIVPDAQAIMPIVHTQVADRHVVHAADLAYLLGQDRAREYLKKDLETYPSLRDQLEVARRMVRDARVSGDDLYGAWLKAVRALGEPVKGMVPSAYQTDAFRDLRLNSAVAAYGQLKHNYVLVAGEPYSQFGCAIPDGYVEPVPAVYEALADYAERGRRMAEALDSKGTTGARSHFERMAQVLAVLQAIVADELENRPLTRDQKRWLSMVAELSQDRSVETTGYPPTYTGWYFDLLYLRESDGMRDASFIADFFTSQEGVGYVGASVPRLGIFAVDTGGAPRAFVGPVAHAFEHQGELARRLADADARTLPAAARVEPWALSYTSPAPAEPAMAVRLDYETGHIVLTTEAALGEVTVELLDHHRQRLESKTLKITSGGEHTYRFRKRDGVDGVKLKVGHFIGWALGDSYGQISATFGGMASPNQ